jgi:hypothetical protein
MSSGIESNGAARHRLFSWIWWSSLAFTTLSLMAAVTHPFVREKFFHSDNLYIPTLIEDIWHWSGSFREWSLTPAPYYFPDMLLYALVRPLTPSVEWAQYLSGLAHLLLVIWAARAVVRAAVPAAIDAANLVGVAFAIAMALFLAGELGEFERLFTLSNHGGAALCSLLVLALCLRPFGPMRWRATLASVLLSAAGAYSDPIFAPCCAAPLLVLSVAGLGSRVPGDRELALRQVLSAGIGFAATYAVRTWNAHTAEFVVDAGADQRQLALDELVADVTGPEHGVLWLAAISCGLGLLILLRRRRDGDRPLRMLVLWQLMSMLSTTAGVAWSGKYHVRYLMVPFSAAFAVATAVLLDALVRSEPRRVLERTGWLAAALTALGLAVVSVSQADALVRGSYQSERRRDAECVAAIMRREGVDTVLAEYWYAKPLMLFSGGQVKALQLTPELEPTHWINSLGWYRGPHQFGMLVLNSLRREEVKRFGPPELREHCGQLDVFVYRGWLRQNLAAQMQILLDRLLAQRPG